MPAVATLEALVAAGELALVAGAPARLRPVPFAALVPSAVIAVALVSPPVPVCHRSGPFDWGLHGPDRLCG